MADFPVPTDFETREPVLLPDGTPAIFEGVGPIPGDTNADGPVKEVFCSVLVGTGHQKTRKVLLLKDVRHAPKPAEPAAKPAK